MLNITSGQEKSENAHDFPKKFLFSALLDHQPYQAGFFSRSPGLRGGGLRGPDAKNQGYHQPIEMKLYHKSMPDAKFESGSFSIFGDMTSQNFTLESGMFSSNSGIYPLKMDLTLN